MQMLQASFVVPLQVAYNAHDCATKMINLSANLNELSRKSKVLYFAALFFFPDRQHSGLHILRMPADLDFKFAGLDDRIQIPVNEGQLIRPDPERDRLRLTRLRQILAKPFSSFFGRVTVLTLSEMYSWTVSAPARLPVLVTVTVASARSSVVISAVETVTGPYSNAV